MMRWSDRMDGYSTITSPDVASGPLPPTFDGSWRRVLHAVAAKLLMALIVLHVAAALWHHAVWRDGLLRRMGFGRRR